MGHHWLDDDIWFIFKSVFNVWMLIKSLLLIWSISSIGSCQITFELMDKRHHLFNNGTYLFRFLIVFGLLNISFGFLEMNVVFRILSFLLNLIYFRNFSFVMFFFSFFFTCFVFQIAVVIFNIFLRWLICCCDLYFKANLWSSQPKPFLWLKTCAMKDLKRNLYQIQPFHKIPSKCGWMENQSKLRSVKFEEHRLFFSTWVHADPYIKVYQRKFFDRTLKWKETCDWTCDVLKLKSIDVSVPLSFVHKILRRKHRYSQCLCEHIAYINQFKG